MFCQHVTSVFVCLTSSQSLKETQPVRVICIGINPKFIASKVTLSNVSIIWQKNKGIKSLLTNSGLPSKSYT